MSVKERLLKFIEDKSLKVSDFEKNVGLSNGYVNNIRKSISNAKAKSISLKYPELNMTWLLLGEGEMLRDAGLAGIMVEEPRIRYPEDFTFIELPLISLPARASFIEMPDGVGHQWHERYRVIGYPGEFAGQVVVEINGDSMEPLYPTGTLVRCKKVSRADWHYIPSGVYVVVHVSFFVVKRVKNSPKEGVLSLHSDNTETGGMLDVPLDQVRQIWKVLRIVDSPAR